MMKKGFSVIELLTVMMIMGLLGTITVGGYRAMQRGMEERGVFQNANAMIRAAYQRAQIDRQPTAVYFWNETLRERSQEENELVVGRAVAIRRHGRLSNVFGSSLVDEFSDLNLNFPVEEDGGGGSARDQMYLYPMDNLSELTSESALRRSLVRGRVHRVKENLLVLTGAELAMQGEAKTPDDGSDTGTLNEAVNTLYPWAFKVEDKGGVQWKPGMAYGFEFLSLQLPVGYIFGSSYSSSVQSPIRTAGTLVFRPGVNSNNGHNSNGIVGGRSTVHICALRPKGEKLERVELGETDSPEEKMK